MRLTARVAPRPREGEREREALSERTGVAPTAQESLERSVTHQDGNTSLVNVTHRSGHTNRASVTHLSGYSREDRVTHQSGYTREGFGTYRSSSKAAARGIDRDNRSGSTDQNVN